MTRTILILLTTLLLNNSPSSSISEDECIEDCIERKCKDHSSTVDKDIFELVWECLDECT